MAPNADSQPRPTRRRLLAAGGAAATGALLGAAGPAAAQSSFDGWFDGVSNYDGVADRTGESEVTVEVGVDNGGQPYGFGPAAVRVDPGTTVVWEWTGRGGSHNVVAENGAFESEMSSEEGHTFSHTFEEEGTFRYVCTPHQSLGMKAAVVVGSGGGVSEPDYGGWFDGVSNYDETVDERGSSEVTVEVGVDNGGQPYGFGPAAVRIDPGTTVVWEWTGRGGSHNVVAQDGSFESDLSSEGGHTFSHTFEEEGVYRYVCTPHQSLGMKGAIVVGDVSGGGGDGGEETEGGGEEAGGSLLPMPSDFVGWLALLMGGGGGLAVSMVLGAESYAAYREHERAERSYVGEQATEAVGTEPVEEIDDGYDPVGTAALVTGYFVLIALLWVFMYFVEFIGGPTITG
ncbi:halocyanin domain-containing protein [Halolamina sp. CBA1230]|uniref:halocyanin domain-containing protein n=1 Tax=Halolamina sp. CBA1230 TaxID=1853690 RepID=UPI0009A1F0F1|nr:halocyanin domain-containing protein [Halolamina sp. CBA1230]QKY18915.1 halocyanin domain-containing protein [Halolamina sp. CBA1230]